MEEEALEEVNNLSVNLGESEFHDNIICFVSLQATVEKMKRSLLKV